MSHWKDFKAYPFQEILWSLAKKAQPSRLEKDILSHGEVGTDRQENAFYRCRGIDILKCMLPLPTVGDK